MPKMKTKRAAVKRFKVTASGKVRYAQGFKNHILTTKSRKRKRQMKPLGVLDATDGRKMKRLLGAD